MIDTSFVTGFTANCMFASKSHGISSKISFELGTGEKLGQKLHKIRTN